MLAVGVGEGGAIVGVVREGEGARVGDGVEIGIVSPSWDTQALNARSNRSNNARLADLAIRGNSGEGLPARAILAVNLVISKDAGILFTVSSKLGWP